MSVNKSEKAFRTITEVSEILELPPHVLRFWESKFKYIKPMKRGGGRRYYRPEDIHLLLGIKFLLYSNGLTIKGAQKEIQSKGVKSIAKLGEEKSLPSNANPLSQKNLVTQRKQDISFKSLNLADLIINPNCDAENLKSILDALQQIRNRIRKRCDKRLVT